jgi:hypothetical protein
MRKHLVAAILCCAVGAMAPAAEAQLAPMGRVGVAMGHLHLTVSDVEGHRQFWAQLGGTPVTNGQLQLIQFPGVFVMLRKAEPTGGMAGSSVDHFGFTVKDLAGSLAKWRAAGLNVESTARPTEVMLMAPNGVRVQIVEDKALDVPIKMRDIHFETVSPSETQAWYVKTFGATPGKRGQVETAELPGVTLTFAKANGQAAPTKGRALDHIGFEIRELEQFVKKLEASGAKMDRPFTRLNNSKVTLAFLVDPWGTNIELNENLSPE